MKTGPLSRPEEDIMRKLVALACAAMMLTACDSNAPDEDKIKGVMIITDAWNQVDDAGRAEICRKWNQDQDHVLDIWMERLSEEDPENVQHLDKLNRRDMGVVFDDLCV